MNFDRRQMLAATAGALASVTLPDALFAQQSNLSKDDPGVQALAKSLGGSYLGRIRNTDMIATYQVATSGGSSITA